MKTIETDGCVLRSTENGKGAGVFAVRGFEPRETVIVGVVERRLESNNSHATQLGPSEWVQLADLGPLANHSCDPNCGIRVNERGAPDVVARRLIAPGEEITFDYAMRNYSIDHFPARCRCGSARCRQSVTGWKDLPGELRAEYRGYVLPYLLEM